MMKKEDIKKVVLAYSGGLDTSIIIPWLKENYNNCKVIAVSGNVGQADELDGLEEKAIKTGASKLYVLDLTDEYVDDYIIPTMQAGAMYEEYLLGTSHARPCIAKGLVEIAQKEGADAIAHGCTGKGNDQVRFELAVKHFAPDMPIIAPWREWDIKSREEEIAYAEAHNVPLKINRETNYSKDKNLWHLSHEGLDLEDPGNEPQYEKKGFLELGVSPIDAPDAPTYVTLDFEQGKPVALDGPTDTLSVFNAHRAGDKAAVAAIATMCDYLGYAMAQISAVVDPQIYLIGGGVGGGFNLYAKDLRNAFRRYCLAPSVDTRILPASLGNDAAMYGCAYQALVERG